MNNNNEHAFGWPPGTVRGILAFGIWAGIFMLIFCALALKWAVPEPIMLLLGVIAGSGSMITGFYFGEKKANADVATHSKSLEKQNKEVK